MSSIALVLILEAAAIHAGWNALVKSDMDRLRSIAIIAVFGALSALLLTFVFHPPALAYGISVWAMSLTDMGAVSALRETSILFATLFGAALLKEKLSWQKAVGVLFVTLGVVALSLS